MIHHVRLVGLIVSKFHACYLLRGAGWNWVRIPLGSSYSGSASGVSGHAQSLTCLLGDLSEQTQPTTR